MRRETAPGRRGNPSGGEQGGRPTALRLPGRLVALGVALVSLASIVAGLVLAGRVPAAERLPTSDRLVMPVTTPSASAASVAARSATAPNRTGHSTGWPTRSAGLTGTVDERLGRPTRVDLPSLGLRLPVRPTGVDQSGAMALPPRPGDLGWYRYSAQPGAGTGTTVLGGHVDSKVYGTGPLVELWRLRPGDRLVVQTTTRPQSYVVTAVQRIAKSALDPAVVFARTGPPVLHLLTCGGPYLPARGGYQDNVVVTARPA